MYTSLKNMIFKKKIKLYKKKRWSIHCCSSKHFNANFTDRLKIFLCLGSQYPIPQHLFGIPL